MSSFQFHSALENDFGWKKFTSLVIYFFSIFWFTFAFTLELWPTKIFGRYPTGTWHRSTADLSATIELSLMF